ncbi:MAG: hypothetical protein M3063_03990 [Actinomycetota bacterium]|nr:hypothetical protein [Actinomycetota bacterium]
MIGLFGAFTMPVAQAQTCTTDSTGQCISNPSTSDNANANPGVSDTAATGTNTGGSGGALASTGADIFVALLAAALLILLGTSLTLAARQHRQAA